MRRRVGARRSTTNGRPGARRKQRDPKVRVLRSDGTWSLTTARGYGPRFNQKLTQSVLPPLGSLPTAGPDPHIHAHAFWEWLADSVGRIWQPIAVPTFFEGREECRT